MAFEVACGQCQGRLLVEQTGVVVACPHCGAHLQIGAPAPVPPAQPPQGLGTPGLGAPPQPPAPPPPAPPPAFVPPTMPAPPEAAAPSFPSFSNVSVGGTRPVTDVSPDSTAILSTSAAANAAPPPAVTPPAAPEMPAAPVASIPPVVEQPPIVAAAPPAEAPQSQPPQTAAPVIGPPPDVEMAAPSSFPDFSSLGGGAEPAAVVAPSDPTFSVGLETKATNQPSSIITTSGVDAAASTLATPAVVTSPAPAGSMVPRYWLILAISYASAVTIGFLILYLRGASTLDLPDLVPAIDPKTGQIPLSVVPEDTKLPANHRLKLGESRRFGSVVVTPIKVTRGNLQYEHFADSSQTRPPSAEKVLKLWIKFENVSSDQQFPPLDEIVLYSRRNDKVVMTQTRSNNYVCRAGEQKRDSKRIAVYNLPINGEWTLKGQNLNHAVSPQETYETYIPTNDEDLSSLTGDLVWRLQFRKGYNPTSHRGVLTLLEVEFNSDEIEADA